MKPDSLVGYDPSLISEELYQRWKDVCIQYINTLCLQF